MRRLFLTMSLSAMAVGSVLAQDTAPRRVPGRLTLTQLQDHLGLDSSQSVAAGELLAEYRRRVAGPMNTLVQVRDARRGGVSEDSMAVLKQQARKAVTQLREERTDFATQLRAVLTPEQQQKFEQLRAERRKAFRGMMKQRRQQGWQM